MKENTARLRCTRPEGCGLGVRRRPGAGPATAPAGGSGRRGGVPWTDAARARGGDPGVFAVIESCLKSCLMY